jgi:hypothetical protein
MKKLLLLMPLLTILCQTPQPSQSSQEKPETCCIYEDGTRFIFCIDGKQLGIMLTPIGMLFSGIEGECKCEKDGKDL